MIRKKISISMVIIMLFIVLLWSVSGLFYGMKTLDRDGDGLSDKDEEKIGTGMIYGIVSLRNIQMMIFCQLAI